MTAEVGARLAKSLALSLVMTACQDARRAAIVDDTTRSIDSAGARQEVPRREAPPAPRIEHRAEGWALVLTDEMERALRAAVPGFRHWALSHYQPEVQRAAAPTDKSAPFAAVGDFNGDGRRDVVVDGHDATRIIRLMLFNDADLTRVVILREGSLPPVEQRGPSTTFLSLVPRGIITVDTIPDDDYAPVPVRIDHDGFEVVFWEKAADLFYWRDGGFVQWVTSD